MEHIVLTTFAYEHKVFVGPFARRFPKAKVRVTYCVCVYVWVHMCVLTREQSIGGTR